MRSAIVNLNKPRGITSQQAVSRVKRILRVKKAGHCGTLDPEASGVLLVCVGRATRLADYFQALPKTYRAVLKLGETTDTQDASGTVVETRGTSSVHEADVTAVLQGFVGQIEQIPPMYSALKSEGRPLYKLARKGIEIERRPRSVQIYKMEVVSVELPLVTFDVQCSKGTYIRTLCHDAGEKLGTGGHMLSLVRTAVGDFTIENAADIDHLDEQDLIAAGHALSFMTECRVLEPASSRIRNGVPAPPDQCTFSRSPAANEPFRLHTEEGLFVGVGSFRNGVVKVECLIAPEV